MKLSLFILSVAMPILLILISIGYLRPILRRVLTEICGTPERAEFWIRCATILTLFGALILVLAFGPSNENVHMVDAVRTVLLWALAGAFIGIAWISRVIWNSLMHCPETRERILTGKEISSARSAASV